MNTIQKRFQMTNKEKSIEEFFKVADEEDLYYYIQRHKFVNKILDIVDDEKNQDEFGYFLMHGCLIEVIGIMKNEIIHSIARKYQLKESTNG